MIWFSSESPQYLAGVYKLETLKADLIAAKRELTQTVERRARSENSLGLLDDNLAHLRHNAKVVSMQEYQKVIFQRASELGAIIMDNKAIPHMEKNIKMIESQIERLTGELPSMKAKVLEFKKRD